MARRYDQGTTTFSPEGRLHQVEYAMGAINSAGSTLGVLTKEGVILVGEKKTTSKLLDVGKQHEKLFKISDHTFVAVAGMTSDSNILINKLRLSAMQHVYTYGEQMPVEQLVTAICDTKQSYTQFGGLRPFGVSFLVAGFDPHRNFQLYHTDPSGNFSSWKAHAIGNNALVALQMMKQSWNEDMALGEGQDLVADILVKTMETNVDASKVEMGVIDCEGIRFLPNATVNEILARAQTREEANKEQE